MNRQYLIIFLGLVATTIFTYFIYSAYSKIKIADKKFNQFSLQNKKLADNIAENGKMVKLLLDMMSKLQQQNALSTSDKKVDQASPELNLKFTKLHTDLSLLKQQINDLKQMKPLSDVNMLTTIEEPIEDFKTAMKVRKEKMKQEIEQMESTYEAVLYEGEDDIDWTSDLETKIGNLINSKKLGDDVQLQKVECHTNLCKVHLSHSDQTSLNDNTLMSSLGSVAVYLNTRETTVQGQKNYVMYISKEGESLPLIERN